MSLPTYFIIDLETTGLPKTKGYNNYHPYTENKHYDSSRIVEIAWVVLDSSLKPISQKHYIVRPLNFTIPTSDFHKVTQTIAENSGTLFNEILKDLSKDLNLSNNFLSYNVGFDLNILQNEISRHEETSLNIYIDKMKKICIMEEAKKYLSVSSCKLIHAYELIFGEEFENSHSALPDVLAAKDIFVYMRENKRKLK